MAEESIQLPSPSLLDEEPEHEQLTASSSSSSFVPIEIGQDAVQVINDSKEFNSGILEYVNNSEVTGSNSEIGNNYHIISVFGSQSTGKSTLLNALFNTNFHVMDESRREQTTKGIWMAHSPQISTTATKISKQNESIFVLDVEGTDGRERGEDQDFERKAALFALSTSEVLIINMWEGQIGLFQGANMGLLKTVFEVNLTLFGNSKLNEGPNSDHKVLLLFVIRDFTEQTPQESLAKTVTDSLLGIWESLNKLELMKSFKLEDFFDLKFHTLGHKVFQPEKFHTNVKKLGDKFTDLKHPEYLFKPNYHHNIPVDGWTMYAEQCWEQINSNKDLDLPTQQVLVAKFKCDEILNEVYDEFLLKYNERIVKEKQTDDYEQLGLYMADLFNDTVEDFDHLASRYNKSVYEDKKQELVSKLHLKFQETFVAHIKKLSDEILLSFQTQLKKEVKSKSSSSDDTVVPLIGLMEILKESHEERFTNTVESFSLGGALSVIPHYYNLSEKLEEIILQQQFTELNNISSRVVKKLSSGLNKFIIGELSEPDESSWDKILQYFETNKSSYLQKYHKKLKSTDPETQDNIIIDFGLGTFPELNQRTIDLINFQSWNKFHGLIRKYASKDNFSLILKERFEDKFRYDDDGLPRLYQNVQELEINFKKAKDYALKIVPFISLAKLSNGSEIIPEFDIFSKSLQKKYAKITSYGKEEDDFEDSEDEDDEDEGITCFATIISEKDKSNVLGKFKKETDAIFVETNRAIVQHVTQIPYYIYIIIVVLGWNEFMAVLRNPLFFLLLIIIGAGVYILHTMNLLRPAIVVVQKMFDEALIQAKSKAKEWILDENEFHARNLGKMNTGTHKGQQEENITEEIELDDLSPVETNY